MTCPPLVASALSCALVASCAPDPRPLPTTDTFGGTRPVKLHVPIDYAHERATPLLLVLHGYSASGLLQLSYLGFDALPDEEGVLVAAPEGTADQSGKQFWNATDACCDFWSTGVDDVAYLTGLVRDISAQYNVDPKRVYLVGHSNDGFMSYRLACDHPELFAGLVSIAGATFQDASRCAPGSPVSVLQIHGTSDDVVGYGGDSPGGLLKTAYPGAREGVELWRRNDGCTGALADAPGRLDLDAATAGEETTILRASGCPSGVGVELWTLEEGEHVPAFNADFHRQVWGWLAAHAKE